MLIGPGSGRAGSRSEGQWINGDEMIHRNECYNPKTADRGITEVTVTKHHNGTVGTAN